MFDEVCDEMALRVAALLETEPKNELYANVGCTNFHQGPIDEFKDSQLKARNETIDSDSFVISLLIFHIMTD